MTEEAQIRMNEEERDSKCYEENESPEVSLFPGELQELYAPVRIIGEGSQGKVYLAERRSDGRKVAVKEIQVRSLQNWKDYDLFRRESAVLQSVRLKGVAEFIASYEYLSQDNPAAYIVQEYIDGRSLDDMIHAGYRFTIQRVFEIVQQILELLEKLHHHDPPIIHRDIKPSNVMLKPRGNDRFDVYLIDFGAVANPQVQDGGSTVAGTYGYMPPEQLMGNPCAASDLYSLGVLLAYMLSGVEPVNMQTSDFRLIIDPHLENVPRPVVRMLQRMLEPDTRERLSDYGKLKEMFRAFAEGRYLEFAEKSTMTPRDWNRGLENVRFYGQPGNIDLWMQLPETQERSSIPKSYRILKQNKNLKRLSKYLLIGVFIFLLACLLGISDLMDYWITAIVVFCAIELSCLFWGIQMIKYERSSEHAQGRIAEDLLRHGRKGIATVVEAIYSSVRNDMIHPQFGTKENQFRATCSASFRLRYKFNPPDDSQNEDLIHEITTHQDVSESFPPGSPLPILYDVSADKKRVRSMPFPLPVKEIDLDRDAYCCTTIDGKMVS